MPHKVHHLLAFVLFLCLPLGGEAQDCIDSTRINQALPCSILYTPVCGCDGQTYVNACQAASWYGLTDWTAGPCAEACEAAFMFTHLEGNTFLFYNASSNYDAFTWNFAGELVAPAPGALTAIYTFDEAISTACLYIESDSGCTDTLCLEVYAGAPNEMCNLTDCVWPGDANGNTRANNYDLLNIGMGIGQAGPERPFYPDPADPMAWAPNFSFDWAAYAGPVNFKHLDCDGNGLVEDMDVQAIDMNYTPDLTVFSSPTPGAPPIYLEFEESEVILTDDSPTYFELTAHLYVGEPGNPAQELYGMAFYMDYTLGLAVPSSVTTDYDETSFFGSTDNVLNVTKDLINYNIGRYDYALSRKNQQNVSGYGPVASFSFIIVGDIIEGRPEPEIQFEAGLDGVVMRSANGDTLEYSLKGPAVVTFINQSVSSAQEQNRTGFQVFPNPARQHLTVQLQQPARGQLQLFNALGASVLRQPIDGRQAVANTSMLEAGVYFLVVQTEEGRAVKKVAIE